MFTVADVAVMLVALTGLALVLIASSRAARAGVHYGSPASAGSPPPRRGPSIPDTLTGAMLTDMLRARLPGSRVDDAPFGAERAEGLKWVDGEESVLVRLDALKAEVVGRALFISLPLEAGDADRAARATLVVTFALGTDEPDGLSVMPVALPVDDGLLAIRWRRIAEGAIRMALLALARDHATERGLAPLGFTFKDNALRLIAAKTIHMGSSAER